MAVFSLPSDYEHVIRCRLCRGPATYAAPGRIAVTPENEAWVRASRHLTIRQNHDPRGPAQVALFDDRREAEAGILADHPDWHERIRYDLLRNWPKDEPVRVTCHRCGAVETRVVGEEDRYFQVEFRGQTLWAANRDHALALLEFIEGTDRRRLPDDVSRAWARRVPTHFLTAKGRETIVKRLRRLIEEYEA